MLLANWQVPVPAPCALKEYLYSAATRPCALLPGGRMGCLQACSQMWSAQEAPSGESFGGLGTQSKPPALCLLPP